MSSINDILGSKQPKSVKSGTTKVTPKPKSTLEAHHHEILDKIDAKKSELPALYAEMEALEEQRELLPSHNFDEIQRLTDLIKILGSKIIGIEKGDEVYDYFLDIGDMLYSYSEPQKEEKVAQSSKHIPANSILRFFMEEESKKVEADEDASFKDKEKVRPKASEVDTSVGKNRDKLLEHFLAKVDIGSVKDGMHPDAGIDAGWDTCLNCNADMNIQTTEAKLVCNECGYEVLVLVDSDKPSYKDAPRENNYFAYKKINHFNEWLAHFQAKDNSLITHDVMGSIMVELQKQHISNPWKLKKDKILEILHKLKLVKLYDHVDLVKNRIQQQITNLTLTKEQEERLQHVFKEIQPSFIKYCPNDRSNFLSYPYVIYKLCQLLEMDEFLPCFQLLKARDKLYKQDKVWQKICADMQWQFIKTI